jgi:hypothetical protein
MKKYKHLTTRRKQVHVDIETCSYYASSSLRKTYVNIPQSVKLRQTEMIFNGPNEVLKYSPQRGTSYDVIRKQDTLD